MASLQCRWLQTRSCLKDQTRQPARALGGLRVGLHPALRPAPQNCEPNVVPTRPSHSRDQPIGRFLLETGARLQSVRHQPWLASTADRRRSRTGRPTPPPKSIVARGSQRQSGTPYNRLHPFASPTTNIEWKHTVQCAAPRNKPHECLPGVGESATATNSPCQRDYLNV
jgi:hypothetical protein